MDEKISQLPQTTSVAQTDLINVITNTLTTPESEKVTKADLTKDIGLSLSGLDASKGLASATPNATYFSTDTGILYESDGTIWNVIGNLTEGIEAPVGLERRIDTMIITPGDSVSTFTAKSASLTTSDDTTDYILGSQSMKFVTNGGAGTLTATKTLGAPIDLSDKVLMLAVKVDDFTTYSDFQVRLSSDNFVSGNFDYCKPVYTGLSQRWVEQGKWAIITIGRGYVTNGFGTGQYQKAGTGLADYTAVNAIQFKFVDTGVPMTMHMNKLSYFTRPQKGILSLVFDDSRQTHATIAAPYMDKYGLRGTSAIIIESILSGSSAYMTLAQVKALKNNSKWDIISHAYSNAAGVQAHSLGYDSLTTYDGLIDFLKVKHYLRTNGLRGVDYMALPHGTWSINQAGTANPNPDVLGMLGQYLNACRTTYSSTWETYPAAERMKLRAYTISGQNGDTAAQLLGLIDEIVVNNKGWLILNVHNLVATIGNSSDFLISEFQALIDGIAARVAASTIDYKTLPDIYTTTDSSKFGQSGTLGSAIPLQDSATAPTAGTSTLGARQDHKHPRNIFDPVDHNLISWAYDPSVVGASSTPLAAAGTMYVTKLHVPVATSITNILTYVLTAGATLTSGQCFAALYQNGILLGTTADQSTAWASTGLKTMALTGGPITVGAGDVYVAFWFNGTTGPAFARQGGVSAINAGLAATASRYGTANTTITTTAPSTMGTIAALGVAYWSAIS